MATVTASAQTGAEEVTFTKLANREPMDFDAAMSLARKYAEDSVIDHLILWRDETVPHFWCQSCDRYFPPDEVMKPATVPLTLAQSKGSVCPNCGAALAHHS